MAKMRSKMATHTKYNVEGMQWRAREGVGLVSDKKKWKSHNTYFSCESFQNPYFVSVCFV